MATWCFTYDLNIRQYKLCQLLSCLEKCPVLAAIRIIGCIVCLGVPAAEPLAAFKHKSKGRVFITDTLVATHLCGAASAVLNINKSDNDLNLWSTHSIRVTAANPLHREKFVDSVITKHLRWNSYAFMEYLRVTNICCRTSYWSQNLGQQPPPIGGAQLLS